MRKKKTAPFSYRDIIKIISVIISRLVSQISTVTVNVGIFVKREAYLRTGQKGIQPKLRSERSEKREKSEVSDFPGVDDDLKPLDGGRKDELRLDIDRAGGLEA